MKQEINITLVSDWKNQPKSLELQMHSYVLTIFWTEALGRKKENNKKFKMTGMQTPCRIF